VPDPGNKSYLKYSGLGLQLFVTIGLFGWLGYKMDKYWNDGKPLFIIIMIFLGIIGGFYQFYKAVNHKDVDKHD
jgi:F0F1-type ATP synthase assembly protein I